MHGNRLVMACADRLFVFDAGWSLVDELAHPLMADVHDVLADERGVWVAATGCDTLLLLGWDGVLLHSWPLRENGLLMEALGFPGRWLPPIDPAFDYRDPRIRANTFDALHLNGLAPAPDGDGVLLSLGRVTTREEDVGRSGSSVLALFGDGEASILLRREGVAVPNHNVGVEGDLLLYNDSNRHCLVVCDLPNGTELRTVPIAGDPPFVRGLARIEPEFWLVGSQAPLALYAVDILHGKRLEAFELGGVEHEAVYAICPLPDTFSDPQSPVGADPYAFWKRAALGPGVTPIPI